MRNDTERGHMVDLLFTLALFCVFAASSLMVVIIGADVYKNTANGMQTNFNLNTALCYVTEKIRQNDMPGAISVGELNGEQALILEQRLENENYRTYIYYNDGALCEIFTAASNEVASAQGQRIVELQGFHIQNEKGVFLFEAVDKDGQRAQTVVAPRCS